MINKQSALTTVAEIGEHQVLTESELIAAYHGGVDKKPIPERHRQSNLSVIFYALGTAILVLGVGILSAGYWQQLSDMTRVVITLGTALAAYLMGMLLTRYSLLRGASTAFHVIGGVLLPIGLLVTFATAGFDANNVGMQVVAAFLATLMYGISYWLAPRNLFLLFVIAYATWLFLALGLLMGEGTVWYTQWEYVYYLILTVGLSYIALSQAFLKTSRNVFSGWLGVVGSIAFLGAALVLGGWAPNDNITWQVAYPVLAFGVIYLSIIRRTKTFLLVGAGFLMIYIIKLSAEYFTENIGWPFALMIGGLALIGLGYLSLKLNERYIKE